ncbi:DUF4102 domain-containing protein [Lampropedia puyangensis]|uniref:DUF4102 domain-containing protein n=1 Tax=Lampropedia puyangensis TaxID=1330072 RepID=A0A4S8EQF5_9BURK|nr:site-specific integrase [Lampropedia puyangensis]THT95453.1 DUF4102 domain-containing protein [Lampropedia puyangensis]
MPKIAKELRALDISRLGESGHHPVGGVVGLYLYITPNGAKSWVLRTMIAGKRRHMGLGAYPTVPLAQAREKARQARDEIINGNDPIAQRKQAKSLLQAQQATEITFAQAAQSYIDAHSDGWKNPKHRAQWTSTLETYVFPVMGKLMVKDVAQTHVLQVLEPIWKTKTETATRIRGRMESVLDWATVRHYRDGDNPARWKGHLDKLLAPPTRIQKVIHHKAIEIDNMPTFMAELRKREGIAPRALELAIYCAARSGEVRGSTWDEVDFDKQIWVIPAERMKAGSEHRVPLSRQCIDLLKKIPRLVDCPYIFPSTKSGMLSDMALLAVMRRMEVDAVPHGFRSTFRDWAGEKTNYPRDVAEQALAHTLTNKVEAAYRRGDALEKRRQMMQDWADFCHAPLKGSRPIQEAFLSTLP